MKKFDDIFKMSDLYNYIDVDNSQIIGNNIKEDESYHIVIEYALDERGYTNLFFTTEFDFTIFKQWMLDKNEEIYCINRHNGCEEYIFKKHILTVEITKGEILSCYGKLYFGTPK